MEHNHDPFDTFNRIDILADGTPVLRRKKYEQKHRVVRHNFRTHHNNSLNDKHMLHPQMYFSVGLDPYIKFTDEQLSTLRYWNRDVYE